VKSVQRVTTYQVFFFQLCQFRLLMMSAKSLRNGWVVESFGSEGTLQVSECSDNNGFSSNNKQGKYLLFLIDFKVS
jgi:hypothetical protein